MKKKGTASNRIIINYMKAFYNYGIAVFLFFILCISGNLNAQVSISSNVSPLVNSIGSNTLAVTLNYNSNSCSASTSTVTIAFPSGVSYVQGSVIKTGGTAALNIGYVSGPNSAPQFTVTGGGNGTTITFSVLREANCAAVSTNDTIYVTTPCISSSIGTTLPNTNKSVSVNYNISSPYLFITPQAAINNASIGSTYTRTVSVGNSGVSCIDTLHFFTVRKASSLQLISLNIGSIVLVPSRFQGDTIFYDISGILLPTAGALCNNGQNVVFTETVKLLNCVDLNTKYGAGWGNGTSTPVSSIGKWCSVAQTPSIPITLTNGVANFTGYNYVGTSFVNMCTAFTYTTTYTTVGSGAMYNTHIKAGLYAMWWGPTGVDLNVHNIQDVYLQNALGTLIPAAFTFDSSNDIDVNMNQFNYDPDGTGTGFADLNGDGIYNDLPAGNTFTLVIKRQYNCNETCSSNNYIDASAPNGNLTWDDMCGNAVIGQHLTSGPYNYGASGNIVPDLSVSIPPNVIGGTNFDLQICPTIVANWNYPASAAGHYWEWKLVLPPGVTLNSAGYGPATNYTVSGNTVTVMGNTGAAGLDCLKANLVYNCGVTDTLTFNYSLSYINDITSNCRCRGLYVCGSKVFTIAKCPSSCAIGLVANKPQTGRTNGSFGYTDNTLTTRVSPASISLFERQLALYLDTVFIKGSAVQLGNANNGYIEFKINKAGTDNVLVPELTTSTFKHYRAGSVLNAVNGLLAVNVTTLSNATTSIYRYNFTSDLSGGQLLNNDSIIVDLRFIVSTNNLPGSPVIPSGISWQSFNIINFTKVTCDSTGWIPIIYPIRTSGVVGVHGSSNTSANCGGVSSMNFLNQRSVQMSFFENEYRPEKYNDSITVFIPNGYVFSSFTLGSLDQSYSAVCAPPQVIPPSHMATVAGGKLYTFINDGTWAVPPIHTLYQYGLGSFKVDVKATCSSPEVVTVISNVYYKDYYYTYSQPKGTLLAPPVGSTYLSSGSAGFTINYPSVTKPAVSLTNQTGTVIFAKPTETFNLRVNSVGFNTATNVWVATDGNPNITIIQMVDAVTNATITPVAYNTGTVTGSLFNLSAAGIPSGNFKDYTVYFTYNSCINDSIKLYSGWNCDNFPIGNNPLTDLTTCPTTPIYVKLNPQSSKFQLSVTQNPATPGINLCTSDTVMVVMNSIDAANIVNPSMTFTVLPGVSVSAVLAEYPLNSGQWQPIAFTATTTPVNMYYAAIGSHTNIGSQGLPGTYYGNTPELRQIRVKIAYSADCNYVIGSYIGITGKGYRVCDQTVEANSDYNGFIKTANINVNGTSANGATASVDLSMVPAVLSCSNTVLPLTMTPYFQPTGSGDIVTYILPDNISYVPGSFVSGIPAATLGSVTTAAGTTTLIVQLPVGAPVNIPVTYSISVTSCGLCKTNKIKGTVTKIFSGFTCNNIVCSNFPAFLGSDSVNVSTDNPVVNIIPDTVCAGSISSITTYTGTSSTTHTFTAAGDYTVSVQTAANGCDSTVVFAVRLSPNPPTPVISDTSLCDGRHIVLSPAIPPGQAFTWYDQPVNGNLLSANSYTTPNLSAGTYTYYVEAGETITPYGCKSVTRDPVVVTVFNNPSAINVNNAAICIGQQTATLIATGAVSYSWAPAAFLSATTGSVVTANPPASQNYTITGANSFGCTKDSVITITVNPLPLIAVPNSTICVGQQTATLTANGATAYSWAPGTGLSVTTGSVVLGSPVSTQNYTVTGTDVNGCINTTTATVFVNSLPPVTTTSSTICVGQQTATLTAGGALSYVWNTGEVTLSVTQTPVVTTGYTVTGTDVNGCTNTSTATVLVNNLPAVTATNATICIGQQTATLTAAGAQTYTWSTGSVGTSITQSPIATTGYTVEGTDVNGCVNTVTTSVLVNTLPVITATSATICIGQQTATLTAAGAQTYTWSTGSVGTSITQSPLVTTNYTVAGTDSNGCININTATVSVNNLPTVTTTSATICRGQQTATLTAAGAQTYIWNNGAMVASISEAPLVTTIYTVAGMDINGCVNTATTIVLVNNLPAVTATSATICVGQQTGTLTAGGAQTYTWSTGGIGATITDSPPATTQYTVSGTDMNGCVNTRTTTVIVNTLPVITVNNAFICAGLQTATLTAVGAQSYTWSTTETTATITQSPLTTSNYSVTGIDVNGCVNVANTTIIVFAIPTANFIADSVCHTLTTHFADASNGNGSPITNYAWDFNANNSIDAIGTASPNYIFANAGNTSVSYTVFSTPRTGLVCVNSIIKNIWVNPNPVASFSVDNRCINSQPNSFNASSSTISAGSNTAYNWNYGDASNGTGITSNHSYVNPGIYTVSLTVTSSKGCTGSISKQTEVYQKPQVSILADQKICLGQSMTFTATSLPNSGTVINWMWDFNNVISTIEASGQTTGYMYGTAGTKTLALVTETDKGCRDTLKRSVYINYLPNPLFTADKVIGCPVLCVNFTNNTMPVTGNVGNASQTWFFGDGASANAVSGTSQEHCYSGKSNSQLTEYNVRLVVQTDSGCVNSLEKQNYISVYPQPVAAYTAISDPGTITTPLVVFTNQSQNFTSWVWHFGDGTSTDQVNLNPIHLYNNETAQTYHSYLTVFNQYGCKDSVFVSVDIKPEFVFYIPNAFTPSNRDDMNDLFTGKGIGIETYEMWVYDRWGEKLYHTNTIAEGWDGKYKGATVQQGVYIWKVSVKDVLGKTHEYIGHVTVL